MRPKSIVQYEQVYAASIVIGLLSLVFVWPTMQGRLAASPVAPATIGAIVLVAVLIGLAINLLLLWLTARKGNEVARIIAAVFFAIGIVSGLWGIVSGGSPGIAAVFRVVQIVLEAILLYLLFVPAESKAWFKPRLPVA